MKIAEKNAVFLVKLSIVRIKIMKKLNIIIEIIITFDLKLIFLLLSTSNYEIYIYIFI